MKQPLRNSCLQSYVLGKDTWQFIRKQIKKIAINFFTRQKNHSWTNCVSNMLRNEKISVVCAQKLKLLCAFSNTSLGLEMLVIENSDILSLISKYQFFGAHICSDLLNQIWSNIDFCVRGVGHLTHKLFCIWIIRAFYLTNEFILNWFVFDFTSIT